MSTQGTDKHNGAVLNFFAELRRRRVLPIAGAYIAGAWLATEILAFLFEQLMVPDWGYRLLAIVFVVGFPVSVVLAWVVQVQADGSWVLDSSRGQRRVVISAVTLGLLATAGLSWLIIPRTGLQESEPVYTPIPNSVAILPLADSDATSGERSVADTIRIALLEGLNQSHELVQIRLPADLKPENPLEFGRSIKAAALLDGSIARNNGETLINIRLLDTINDSVIWSQSFAWEPTRIIDTGTEIANGILASLALPVLERQRFAGTDDSEAYDAFLQGIQHAKSIKTERLALAIDDFQRAIDLDGGYAQAYVALADALTMYARMKAPPEDERQVLWDRAKRAVEIALQLDPDSAAAISKLGGMESQRELKIQAYQRALQLDPTHAGTYFRYGHQMKSDGDLEEAERLFRKALEFAPMDANARSDLGSILFDQGRDQEAFAEIQRSIDLQPGMAQNFHKIAVWNYFVYGRLDESIINWREAYARDPEHGEFAVFLAGTYADLGAEAEALDWLNKGLSLGPTSVWVQNMAHAVYRRIGNTQAALEYVPRLMELDPQNHWGLYSLALQDIEAGRPEAALQRWEDAYPLMTRIPDHACDGSQRDDHGGGKSNFDATMYYARTLARMGDMEASRRLALKCYAFLKEQCADHFLWAAETSPGNKIGGFCWWRDDILLMLGQKDEALKALGREVIDGRRRYEISAFDEPEYDLLRDEPEFQKLVSIIRSDLADQLHRVREMEHNGDLAPTPGPSSSGTAEEAAMR
jgi:tetratricopeptide (TPR) repeat protein